ncbi:MAG: hypothetical protein OEY59_02025 [Deltaproteobacteria bacterium]|nr:hypothetical protein [Deltaproteobacteria bacterium]
MLIILYQTGLSQGIEPQLKQSMVENKRFYDHMYDILSPGTLSKGHAYLDNFMGCFKCHTLNTGVSDGYCMDCHQEIKSQKNKKNGYHGKQNDKECLECHLEHQGVQSELFNLDLVKHEKFGFKLNGGHAGIKCDKCHLSEKMNHEARNILIDGRKKELRSYLGLSVDCDICHNRPHKDQFKDKICKDCHSDVSWGSLKFDHQKDSDFKLEETHLKINCKACHKPNKNDPKTVGYQGIGKKCVDCHEDPHEKRSGTDCEYCHTPKKWKNINNIKKLSRFNHSKRFFVLEGEHKKHKCEDCHVLEKKIVYKIAKYNLCDDCHKDPHKEQFQPRKCVQCHKPVIEWKKPNFNHDKTNFVIKNLHKKIKCKDCHQDGKYVLGDLASCEGCHEDIRKIMMGTHFLQKGNNIPPDAMYPAVPCTSCHQQKEVKVNEDLIRKKCVECHNKSFGDLWDYRLEKLGKRPETQTTLEKQTRLLQSHRFADAF